jgi:hypothetical protein
VAVADEHPPRRAGDLGHLLPPAVGRDDLRDDLADHPIHEEIEELVLVSDVPVDARRTGPELRPEPTHAQRVEALRVGDPAGGVEDALERQGLRRRLAGRRRRPAREPERRLPRRLARCARRWSVGH